MIEVSNLFLLNFVDLKCRDLKAVLFQDLRLLQSQLLHALLACLLHFNVLIKMVFLPQNRQPLFLLALLKVELKMSFLLVGFFYDLSHSIFLSLDLFVRFGQCSLQELSNLRFLQILPICYFRFRSFKTSFNSLSLLELLTIL